MVPTEPMKSMKQLSMAETGFLPKAGKQTRKAVFLAEMETVVPWSRLEALIQSHYPKKGNSRPPMPLGTMLPIHLISNGLATLIRRWKKGCTMCRCYVGLLGWIPSRMSCRTKAPFFASGTC